MTEVRSLAAQERRGVRSARRCLPRSCLFLALSLSCCTSRPAPTSFLLTAQADLPTGVHPNASAPGLQLQPVTIPDYLDTTDIMVRTGAHEVKASATGQWAERLSAGIAHALRDDLARRRPDARVTLGPPTDGASAQVVVTVDTLDMDADGSCVLIAHWSVGGRRGLARITGASGARAGDDARVATLAGLIDRLAARIAAT